MLSFRKCIHFPNQRVGLLLTDCFSEKNAQLYFFNLHIVGLGTYKVQYIYNTLLIILTTTTKIKTQTENF